MSDTYDVILMSGDLFFTSQLSGAVERAGLTSQTCLGMKTGLERVSLPSVRWVIVDLQLKNLDLTAIKSELASGAKLISYGPHVHEASLAAAQEAGCDYVLTKGQISSGLEQLLTQ